MARRQKRRRDAIDRDAVLVGQIAHAAQFLDGGIEAPVGDFRVAADVADAIAGQIFQVRIVGGGALAAQFHQSASCRRGGGLFRSQAGAQSNSGRPGSRNKPSAIHTSAINTSKDSSKSGPSEITLPASIILFRNRQKSAIPVER